MERLPGGIRGPSEVTDAHGRAARRGQPRRRIDALPQKVLPPLRHHTSPSWSLESRDRSRTRPPPVARTRASRAERPPPSGIWTRGLHAAIEPRISAACHTWRSAQPQGREKDINTMTTTTTMMAAPRAPHHGSARHSQHKLQRLSCEAQNQTTVPSEFLLIIIVSSSALRSAAGVIRHPACCAAADAM